MYIPTEYALHLYDKIMTVGEDFGIKVGPLIQFFSDGFFCLIGEQTVLFHSSHQLARLNLGPLKGSFELTWRPSRALDSPHASLPELQRYKDAVRCAALDAEVPGHRQQQQTQTLILCVC